jgi:hypothetical protein
MANVKEERVVLQSYINQYCTWKRYVRNVRLIQRSCPQEVREKIRRYDIFSYLGAKQIDLVVYGNPTQIVEAKVRLDSKAIGQVLTYQILFEKERPEHAGRTELVIACRHIDPDLLPVCDFYGIRVVQV